jgi:hypothetical protein
LFRASFGPPTGPTTTFSTGSLGSSVNRDYPLPLKVIWATYG